MKRRLRLSPWTRGFERSLATLTRSVLRAGTRQLGHALKPARKRRAPATSTAAAAPSGSWTAGLALAAVGQRRFRLYAPPALAAGECLPLMVMLHGCGQDANSFAASTRMNRIAARERFFVLYLEQDRLANGQGCWNWFDTRSGRAYTEATLIMRAVDQVCLLPAVDRSRVAVAGLSAGASMAALLVTGHPGRFKALVMHSGVPPGMAHSPLSALRAMRGRRPPAARAAAAVVAVAAPDWPPLLVIHGSADPVVSPLNGQAAAQFWADAIGARAGPARSVQRGQRRAMAVTDFKRGARTAVTLVSVDGLAHAWSGGAASQAHGDSRGPDASRLAWAFAARQFRG
jgi:poly(hydroxyalkanoate) depolymerase family esterase